MDKLDPGRASAIGRIGGYAKAAKYPAHKLTAAARKGFMARFQPGDPSLDEAERQRRAQAALKAHMAWLAYRSAEVRRQKKRARPYLTEELLNTDRTRMSEGTDMNASNKLIPEAIRNA